MDESRSIKADSRLKTLIENGCKMGHRSLLVILGSETAEQIMVIHHLMSKAANDRPSVLWCHKKGSDVPKQSRKQLKKFEKNLKSGKCNISSENALHLFLLATPIRYCAFSDAKSVLGSTYGMCVIQDFEGLTPNVLCQVIETVKGGGVITIILKKTSLRQLFDIEMDVHNKLKTYSHPNVFPLFNERFVLSLGWCKSCLIMNDQLQVVKELPPLSGPVHPVGSVVIEKQEEFHRRLVELQSSLEDAEKPLPQLIGCCRTVDQAKSLLKMIDMITDKGGRGTVAITAGRGRGKSAVLGFAVAAAIYFGFNNIFVTSPTPDNLRTFYEMVFKGLYSQLGWCKSCLIMNDQLQVVKELPPLSGPVHPVGSVVIEKQEEFHRRLVELQSSLEDAEKSNPTHSLAVAEQLIKLYIDPTDARKLSQAELLVIDEAAAIPLPYVKALLGSYYVLMASTVNGYEGTGRSLSLKLLSQLRQQASGSADSTTATSTDVSANQKLNEVSLKESIRYSDGDPVEKWLNDLLCLDATSLVTQSSTCPPPHSCQLYYVNKGVLFSGNEESEDFLHQIVSLLVASHYRNSPDDLQVLSDAPAHHLFVLLSPIASNMTSLPTVLVVIQISLEGNIGKKVADECKSRGERPSGDLVPWALAAQFSNSGLTKLVTARIVRVATHPDYQSMGYGSRALNLLGEYYRGRHITLDEEQDIPTSPPKNHKEYNFIVPYHSEVPLLSKLEERKPEQVNYMSVSFGVTQPLFKFWKRVGFLPLYISQVSNKITGEHNCVMVHPLVEEEPGESGVVSLPSSMEWVKDSCGEFLRRFIGLLGGPLRNFSPVLALAIIQSHDRYIREKGIDWNELQILVTGHDLQRLERYANNLADRYLINDMFPSLAYLYFMKRLPAVQLSSLQSSIVVGLGLQARTVDTMVKLLDLPVESLLGQLNRAIRRFLKVLSSIQETALALSLPTTTATVAEFTPVDITLEQDLEQAAKDYGIDAKRSQQLSKTSLHHLGDLRKFAVQGDDATWEAALQNSSEVVTIKNKKKPKRLTEAELERELNESAPKKSKGNHKNKKKK
ncbi:RNA cytidine acetyltransferase-like [Macrobrachium nipponense]|uniref:RNA cytidine acetyltransferase-like n=1 Tax=Macrobrachium nipponense TaxID=159736 RepID=UPI0030C87E04